MTQPVNHRNIYIQNNSLESETFNQDIIGTTNVGQMHNMALDTIRTVKVMHISESLLAIAQAYQTIEDLTPVAFAELPTEILRHIFSYCNKPELSALNRTCYAWNGIVKHMRTVGRGLNLIRRMQPSTDISIETLRMLAAGHPNAYTYLSMYGYENITDQEVETTLKMVTSDGYSVLKKILVSQDQIQQFKTIAEALQIPVYTQTTLDPITSAGGLHIIQDPRELYKAEIEELFRSLDWHENRYNQQTEVLLDNCLDRIQNINKSIQRQCQDLTMYSVLNSEIILCAMHKAIVIGYFRFVKGLLDVGLDINTLLDSRTKWTSLHVAVRNECLEVIKLLLNRGATMEARDFIGRTPLFMAVICSNVEAFKLLTENGADIKTQNTMGQSPLSILLDNVEVHSVRTPRQLEMINLYQESYLKSINL